MYYQCCVCKCSREEAILHHFPTYSEKRLNKWLNSIKRSDLMNMSPQQLAKLFVCRRHFEKRFTNSDSRLKISAFPTLFTEDEISSGIPTQDYRENLDSMKEHNYFLKRHFDHTYSKWEPLLEAEAINSPVNKPETCQSPLIQQESDIEDSTSDIFVSLQESSENVQAYEDKVKYDKIKNSKKRLIKKINKMSPICQMLYKEYKQAKKQTSFFLRAKRALQLLKEKALEKKAEGLNSYEKKMIRMQINLCMKKSKRCTFTTEEKLISLAIKNMSPNCYTFLSKIFTLPSKTTLDTMLSQVEQIRADICPEVFEWMKKEFAS